MLTTGNVPNSNSGTNITGGIARQIHIYRYICPNNSTAIPGIVQPLNTSNIVSTLSHLSRITTEDPPFFNGDTKYRRVVHCRLNIQPFEMFRPDSSTRRPCFTCVSRNPRKARRAGYCETSAYVHKYLWSHRASTILGC